MLIQDLCEFMQGQLSEIGIKINLEINQAAQHRQMVAKQQLSFFRGSWIGDYADGENYSALFKSENKAPSGPNYTHFQDAEFDRLYLKAMKETDLTRRAELYRSMDSLIGKVAGYGTLLWQGTSSNAIWNIRARDQLHEYSPIENGKKNPETLKLPDFIIPWCL